MLLPSPGRAQVSETLRGGAGKRVVIDLSARDEVRAQPPRYERYVEGLFARRVFATTDADSEYAVEVWGLLVGPHTETAPFTFRGATVLIARSGRGVVTIGDVSRDLKLGTSVLVPEGEEARILNEDQERSMSLKATVIRGVD